jgi:hypothetical protein
VPERAGLSKRERCGRDGGCIARLTRQRITELTAAPGATIHGTTAPDTFTEPLIDRPTLLRLNLAVRPDLVADELGSVIRAGEMLRSSSAECRTLRDFLQDETQVPEAIALARRIADGAVAAAKAAGPKGLRSVVSFVEESRDDPLAHDFFSSFLLRRLSDVIALTVWAFDDGPLLADHDRHFGDLGRRAPMDVHLLLDEKLFSTTRTSSTMGTMVTAPSVRIWGAAAPSST